MTAPLQHHALQPCSRTPLTLISFAAWTSAAPLQPVPCEKYGLHVRETSYTHYSSILVVWLSSSSQSSRGCVCISRSQRHINAIQHDRQQRPDTRRAMSCMVDCLACLAAVTGCVLVDTAFAVPLGLLTHPVQWETQLLSTSSKSQRLRCSATRQAHFRKR